MIYSLPSLDTMLNMALLAEKSWVWQLEALIAQMMLWQIFAKLVVVRLEKRWRRSDWVEKSMAIFRRVMAGFGVNLPDDDDANFREFLGTLAIGFWHGLGAACAAPAAAQVIFGAGVRAPRLVL